MPEAIWIGAAFGGDEGAGARAGVGFEEDDIAGGGVFFASEPGGDAAGAVAGDFGCGAVGIDKADAAAEGAGSLEELDAIGADAGVAVAEAPGEGWIKRSFDDEEVVAAGVGLGEAHYSSSGKGRLEMGWEDADHLGVIVSPGCRWIQRRGSWGPDAGRREAPLFHCGW